MFAAWIGDAQTPTLSKEYIRLGGQVVAIENAVAPSLPSANLSPNSTLSFSPQTVGTISSPQSVTLSNSGAAALAIGSVAIAGTDFASTNTCGTSLAAQGTCSISVTFTPSAAGIRNATLTVTDNSGNVVGSTQSLQLTGTGTVATAGGAAAAYIGSDSATLGNWTSKYGADGQLIANGLQSPPNYATVNFSGDSTYTFEGLTYDPRALQIASGSSLRIPSVYYSPTVFTIDVNLTDGNTHKSHCTCAI